LRFNADMTDVIMSESPIAPELRMRTLLADAYDRSQNTGWNDDNIV
jgi:hypothetical protein